VYRCAECGTRSVVHRGRKRFRKRYAVVGIIGLSALLWFAAVNVALTGHTRIIHTVGKVVRKSNHAGQGVRAAIHRVEGDRGEYIEDTPVGNTH